MPTKFSTLNKQSVDELYGVVVGLFGDPANQDGSGSTSVFSNVTPELRDLTGAFDLLEWAEIGGSYTPSAYVLPWSRLLLVELIYPYDSNYSLSKLAWVLRPRSLWLYQNDDTTVSDFIGTTTDPDTMGFTTDRTINEVNPPYRRGDVIRVGTLPSPVVLQNFSEEFTNRFAQTYDGSVVRNPLLRSPRLVNSMLIKGNLLNTKYGIYEQTHILHYDKNVDGRTRISSGSGDDGETVTVSLCIGGVHRTYEITGRRLS